MRRFLAASIVVLYMISCSAYAYGSGVICFGADIKESEKQEILSLLNTGSNIDETLMTKDDESKFFPDGGKQGTISGKSAVYAYVASAAENQGIKVRTFSITYVTPEMITESMITAGIKDIEVKTGGPYEISGYSSLPAIITAFEKMTGEKLPDELKLAGCRELQELGILGQKFGMQKSVQFINEIELEILKKQEHSEDGIKRIIAGQEKRFSIDLDDTGSGNIIYIMDAVSHSGLTYKTLQVQQKNIINYLNDQSNTADKKSIIEIMVDKILFFLKKISILFTGNGGN